VICNSARRNTMSPRQRAAEGASLDFPNHGTRNAAVGIFAISRRRTIRGWKRKGKREGRRNENEMARQVS